MKFDTPIALTFFVFRSASIAVYVSIVDVSERRKTPVLGSKGKNLSPEANALCRRISIRFHMLGKRELLTAANASSTNQHNQFPNPSVSYPMQAPHPLDHGVCSRVLM